MNYLLVTFFAFFSMLIPGFSSDSGLKPVRLTCEYLVNPPVIDVPNPRLSWINIAEAGDRGQYQSAFEIRVAESEESLLAGKNLVWSSGKVVSDESVNIRYAGQPLKSRQKYWWQVRVWDIRGKVSDWSESASFATGFFDPLDWKAAWIGAPWQEEEALPKPNNPGARLPEKLPPPAPFLRKEFSIKGKIKRAVAYTTGLGYFELYCNGNKAGNDVLVPNQTNYGRRPNLINENIPLPDNFREYRVMYLAYDLTDYLKEGANAVGTILGNGFYNPAKYWCGSYGTPRFLLQIHISYADGSEEIIVTDKTWKASKGPILMDMVYYGEHYDARLEMPGWSAPGFDDSAWEPVALRKSPEGRLSAHMSYPDRVMEVLDPVKIEKIDEGRYKIDFGQEISGWVHLKNIRGESGRKIEIKYLHQFSPNGENTYTMRGGSPESYHPRFTWFVFREIEVVNWPGELTKDQIKAEFVYTMTETTGKFTCSDKLLEDINRIWWRSQTDNMHGGIASDCPNRERSPYTGDGQVACVTVMHNFDARAFYRKWIDDIIGSSNEETGYVPNGAPWQPGCGGGPAWGAAICIMPWEFYLQYGDTNILSDSYDAMKGYVSYMLTWTDNEGIMFSQAVGRDGKPLRWLNLGDWSQPFQLPPDNMVHTFYLWRCADITANVAKILGKPEEAKVYSDIASKTKDAFHNRFYDTEKGTYGPYGGNIFALRMGVPAERKARVIAALKADIEARDGHLDTGIFGTQFFFEVLADNGLNELAYGAMSKKTAPSYGYWLEQGATTSWEGWQRAGSGNHPMFGGGLAWLYRKLAGMNSDPAQPGYKHIIFRPQPPKDVVSAGYSNLTNYGESGIMWKKEKDRFYMEITVPAGTTATVYLPSSKPEKILENEKPVRRNTNLKLTGVKDGYTVFSVASGVYRFTCPMTALSL